MATIFPREQKAKMLFEKIKENPQACERLMETFYDALGVGDDYEGNGLSAEQFATALFRSYEEKDLTAFLMAICQNSMFDLLRNSFLAPFRFNANGQTNPYILTDEDGKLIPDIKFHVSDKNYEQFFKVFQKSEQVKMYLAYGKNAGDRSAGICDHLGYPDGSAEIPATFGRLLRTGFHGK